MDGGPVELYCGSDEAVVEHLVTDDFSAGRAADQSGAGKFFTQLGKAGGQLFQAGAEEVEDEVGRGHFVGWNDHVPSLPRKPGKLSDAHLLQLRNLAADAWVGDYLTEVETFTRIQPFYLLLLSRIIRRTA